jgi:serine protease
MSDHKDRGPAAQKHPDPVFQAFTVKTTQGNGTKKANKAVANVLGKGWTVQSYGGRRTNFEVFKGENALSVDDAWRLTYLLRRQPGIASAEPIFKAWITDRRDWGINLEAEAPGAAAEPEFEASIFGGILDWVCGMGKDLVKARGNAWSLELTRVTEAWPNHFPGSKTPGEGVLIGHPDSGYRNHPEIASSLLISKGFDFFREDNDPKDELENKFPWQSGGHGTGTASVIVSPMGAAAPGAPNSVSGTAPGAKLIPFRVSDSSVIVDGLNLARAIERAADAGAQVISISMGGLGSERLHDAVVYARNKGVIVLAAAGNCVRFVVFPAAYEEVVAVAACDAELGIWKGSSRGSAVDITAPGDRVWIAVASSNDNDDIVGQSSGTSYAVATVAGIAALWIAKHGRAKLIKACGSERNIPPTFMRLLRETATPVPAWSRGEFGGGLVNADALLNAPLPDGTIELTMVAAPEDQAPIARGGTATFAHLFEQTMKADMLGPEVAAAEPVSPQAKLNANLAALLGTTEDKLPAQLGQIGQELAFHLATNPGLYRQFDAALTAQPLAAERAPGVEAAGPDENVGRVRQELLARGVSPALKARLST